MYYERKVSGRIGELQKGFPVISITGPRQSGKTTFLQNYFSDYAYVNLEDPTTRELIRSDPKQFLARNPRKVIIDEIQRLPDLLSYIQVHVDAQQEMGSIIISGSQNFLVSERISQSLVGRAAYHTMLPFSLSELRTHGIGVADRYEQILKGGYPAVYTRDIAPFTYYDQYIATYVERDVRLIKNIKDLSQFQKFIQLLAGRVGQILNLSSLANDVGISPNTAEEWLSILEASYIVYRLKPYYGNHGKRLVKSPKVFFYDVGLLCALLHISSVEELTNHFAIGGIFENFIISEFKKEIDMRGLSAELFFYRDSNGREVDLLIDRGGSLIPVEIKSSATYNHSFFDILTYWRKHIDPKQSGYVVYGGATTQGVQSDHLVSWNDLGVIVDRIH